MRDADVFFINVALCFECSVSRETVFDLSSYSVFGKIFIAIAFDELLYVENIDSLTIDIPMVLE